ncbi:MAG: C-type cytochrome [Actinobacteria bacterium]|nr:C-type cytochrome [Actinomycetota bacterium]
MRDRPGYFSVLLILLLVSTQAWGDTGKELFEKECSGCHTIGGGDSGGPDLKGVAGKRPAEWLERIIVEPDKLTAEKVQLSLVKKYGGEMPNLGLSRKDARKIVSYLQSLLPAAPAATSVPATPGGKVTAARSTPPSAAPETARPGEPETKPAETVATPDGGRPFANGGAPCAACHSFGYSGIAGGTLAVDLSKRMEAVGEQGLRGMLKSLNFPIMRKIYASRPLTEEETTALVAFSKDAVARKSSVACDHYPATGVGIFVCLIVGLTLYKRRIR